VCVCACMCADTDGGSPGVEADAADGGGNRGKRETR